MHMRIRSKRFDYWVGYYPRHNNVCRIHVGFGGGGSSGGSGQTAEQVNSAITEALAQIPQPMLTNAVSASGSAKRGLGGTGTSVFLTFPTDQSTSSDAAINGTGDEVTINTAGAYSIRLNAFIDEGNSSGNPRKNIEIRLYKNNTRLSEYDSQSCYLRVVAIDGRLGANYQINLDAGDTIKFQAYVIQAQTSTNVNLKQRYLRVDRFAL